MNPTGIAIGWALSDTGDLVTGIFYAISAGTFIYISTIEIIVVQHLYNTNRSLLERI
jgi:zinc transporter 1/2/3